VSDDQVLGDEAAHREREGVDHRESAAHRRERGGVMGSTKTMGERAATTISLRPAAEAIRAVLEAM
jgi:hypothetical protein